MCPETHGLLRLNSDVLEAICCFVNDVPDILTFSLTCSRLRTVLARRLLVRRPISLKNNRALLSFHEFIFADESNRAPHIRSLEIDFRRMALQGCTQMSETVVSCLYDLFRHARRLRSLSLRSCDHLCGDQALASTLHSLASLRDLSIAGWSDLPLAVLANINQPLISLHAHFYTMGSSKWGPLEVNRIISRFAPTLETLGLDNIRIEQALGRSAITQFEHITSLTIRKVEGAPRLDILLQWFPRLSRKLELGRLTDETFYLESCAIMRQQNIRSQDGDSRWKALDELICDAEMFYTLGIRCPIQRLTITHNYSESWWTRFLQEGLRDSESPPRLSVTIPLTHGLDIFDVLSSDKVSSALSHLVLCMHYETDDPGVGNFLRELCWRTLLNRIISSLQRMRRLRHVRIIIDCRIILDAARPPQYSTSFVDSMRTFAIEDVARTLTDAAPSLEHLFLTASGSFANRIGLRTWQYHDVWSFSRAWGRASSYTPEGLRGEMVELGEESAEDVILQEDLGLSEDQKRRLSV